MNNRLVGHLCLHGALLMFAVFASGFMMGFAGVGQIDASVDDWKVAHNEALLNSLVLFIMAGVLGKLTLTPGKAKLVVLCLILMAYCNSLFGFMRGATGMLGYQFNDSMANNVTALAGMVGVPLAVVAFTLILLAAWRTVRG